MSSAAVLTGKQITRDSTVRKTGDVIVADDDGVVILPAEGVRVLEAGDARAAKEAAMKRTKGERR